ncbi:hypothetical protein TGP89_273915 [Toxoplasma gondii p89]|uniref:Uncharacterized protein n=1 Tax=Toxoplasma gondii p89 TaxID=943119 RepID=A0A086L4I3_TOXGO|nr:hypothetical protein TGP89_273915 [Toxoplasma gondii p89]
MKKKEKISGKPRKRIEKKRLKREKKTQGARATEAFQTVSSRPKSDKGGFSSSPSLRDVSILSLSFSLCSRWSPFPCLLLSLLPLRSSFRPSVFFLSRCFSIFSSSLPLLPIFTFKDGGRGGPRVYSCLCAWRSFGLKLVCKKTQHLSSWC